jgi:hypothetical protein
MPLNNSGPISLAGATAGQSIAVELGLSATGTISLNDSNVRTLAGVPSGAIVMPTNFYGKSNRVQANITLSANTANYVLNTAKVTGYVAGSTDTTLTINSGVFVSSGSTGSYALTVNTSWAAGDTVTIVNSGTIVGRGGNGGNNNCASGDPGGVAGPALLVQRATSVNNINRIAGGGGGGGGGCGGNFQCIGKCGKSGPCTCGFIIGGAGAGGGGIGGSVGGTAASCSNSGGPGGAGTLTAAGGGGPGGEAAGGSGGGYGAAGGPGGSGGFPNQGAGGAGGAAVVGNSNITWIAFGTRNGSIS